MDDSIIMMDFLKENSVKVCVGTVAVFPQYSNVEARLNLSNLVPKFNQCYAITNYTVGFVTDGEIFVTPYTQFAVKTLCEAGFRHESFYVPFNGDDYPKEEKDKWRALKERVKYQYTGNFTKDCNAYCDQHNIGGLPCATLMHCFEMPEEGVRVKIGGIEKCYYPILTQTYFDSYAAMYIGRFGVHNGIVIFVCRNGKTYVAKGEKIQSKLIEAGYTKASIFVPFSNGEDRIINYRLRSIIM